MRLIDKLFGFKRIQNRAASTVNPETQQAKSAYLTETVIFGMHPYRSAGEDSSVYLVNESQGIRKKLIDSAGNIQNFPGIIKEEFWVSAVSPKYLKPQVCFRSSFEKRDNGWIFKWQVQPDGWYWADEDGFGAEDDPEVILYTFVDTCGRFSGPFQIYKFGNTGYAMDRFTGWHVQSQEQMLTNIRDEERHLFCPSDIFPQLLDGKMNHISDRFYQLRNKQEALAYWNDSMLSRDLVMLATAMLDSSKSLGSMVGEDYERVWGCMTLFYMLGEESIFKQVLDKFFDGKLDEYTVRKLNEA